VTGRPVWPIEERAVEKGEVPGEWYSPTQPFVTKPPPFEEQGVTVDSLIDFTPELRAEAIKVASRYKMGPLFTPPVVSKWEGPLGILMLPNITGGANWQGGSFDPETKMFYIFTNHNISSLGLVPGNPERNKDFAWVQGTARDPNAPAPAGRGGAPGGRGAAPGGRGAAPGARGAAPGEAAAAGAGGRGGRGGAAGGGAAAQAAGGGEGGGGGLSVRGLPLVKPPYGRITALDMNKGELAWQIAHGETPDNIKNNPALKGLTIPRTGRQGRIGVLTTKTLVIAGEGGFATTPNGRGAYLRAYNKATGEEVGAVYMPAPQTGSPMTYLHNGQQYIAIAIAGPGYSGELLTFKLPPQ
jgi:quinoprotein glucose dehydrogenase